MRCWGRRSVSVYFFFFSVRFLWWRKSGSPEFLPKSTICGVFSRIMKQFFLREWEKWEGEKWKFLLDFFSAILEAHWRGNWEAWCQTRCQVWLCSFLDPCSLVCFCLLHGDEQTQAIYLRTQRAGSPQSFRHQGPVLWKTIVPSTGVGGLVSG